MKLSSLSSLLLTILLLPAAAGAQAQSPESAPDVLVKSVTNEVLDIIHKDKDIQSGNNRKAIELIDAKVLPHFNFIHMTQLALGRDWRTTSAAQKTALSDEFRILLVRTYSKALTEYKNQSIEFKPLHTKAGDTEAKVNSLVNQPGGKGISLNYYLEKLPAGWMVYDIEADGISLVINYRDSFAAEVRKSGIDSLINSLHAKNAAASAGGK
jgi:phospholipid transport system substrate-binding protein